MLDREDAEIQSYEDALNEETLKAIEEALDAVEKEKELEKEKTVDQLLLDYIRKVNKKQEKVVSLKKLKLVPPEGISKDEINELIDNRGNYEVLASLAVITLSKDSYIYDPDIFTQRFAQVEALIEEKDILSTIANVTRHDCKVYPRPVKVSALQEPPFRYSQDEILGALARMKFEEGFEDIATVKASNGNMCLYSTQYMSEKYARSLAEYIEVERQRDL